MANAKTNGPKTVPTPEELSKAELDTKRKDISKYYKENVPHLKTQLEYEELLRDIEKTRAERLQAQMYIAQTMAPDPDSEDDTPVRATPPRQDGQEAAEAIKRTLKKQI
tara:strand:+ start:1655 stop:1981 length:327 start_codon:yes stop_codon:yes gene_type:complete